jgi:hypothetical protein
MTDTTPETFNWLEFHKNFQENTYGTDYSVFETDFDARTEFVQWNLYAAGLELAEPWSSRDPKEAWLANRDSFVTECVDVLFFLANALNAVGATDLEIAEKYLAKAGVNTKRQETGYDAHSTKCPGCKRELDKDGAYDIVSSGDERTAADGSAFVIFELQCTACGHGFEYTVTDGTWLP